MEQKIAFNRPYFTGDETTFILDAVKRGHISGDGYYTQLCQKYFEERYGFGKTLMTTSCTDALEMAAILLDIGPGDEVIMPSYTFMSAANAFLLRGAKIIFTDCSEEHPNIDENRIEDVVTDKTKAVVPVHYAGVACNMEKISEVCKKHGLYLVEDAAQGIDAGYRGQPLGSFGEMATLSFHETKNIISGEGGLLCINDQEFMQRAEVIREKGTNRSAFFRGEVDKYGWVDIGSSFLPSDVISAILWSQLKSLDKLQEKRKEIWERYWENLSELASEAFELPKIPENCSHNCHIFYLVLRSEDERDRFIAFLRQHNIHAVFHYQSLHKSKYFREKHDGRTLPNSEKFATRLVRLPLYQELSVSQIDYICDVISDYVSSKSKM